jgi:hypothetical protein
MLSPRSVGQEGILHVESVKSSTQDLDHPFLKTALLKGTVPRVFYLWFFFIKLFLPGPVGMPRNDFNFFRLFAEIFYCFGASPASTTPAKHALLVSLTSVSYSLPVSTTPVSDTFTVLESFTSVNDTGKKLLTGFIGTREALICRCQ